MQTVEVVIRLPQNLYFDVKNGHASNIQRERVIEQYNPIIYLTVNGEYIEAISLDYLNGLQAIIETDKEVEK